MTSLQRMAKWCLCGLVLASCSAEPTASTPTGALQLFLDAMERSSSDETALEEAYRLLDVGAKAELGKRASLATSLSQRTFEPWEMLPQGRFRLRFRPRRMRVIDGPGDGKATVVVTGAADGQRADVEMSFEDEAWRVVLDIPPVHGAGGADGLGG